MARRPIDQNKMPNAEGSAPTARFDAVLEAALAESSALALRAATAADQLMLNAATVAPATADRRRLEDAAAALRACRGELAAAFPAALREELSGRPAATAAPALTFDSLELMADDQMDDTVELVRGQQLVKEAVEHVLVPFNALVSAAQGHERVRTAANPLRPESWVRALHRSIAAAMAAPQPRALVMFHMSLALGPELADCYQQLCERLRQQGVTAAAFGVAPDRAAAGRAPGPAGGHTGPTLRELKALLASVARGGDAPAAPSVAGATQTMGGMTMPAAMEALQGMKRMEDVVRRMQERWRQGVWQAESAGAQDGAAGADYTAIQTLAREVVRLMVANITADARLLPEVQQAVRDLEPALLRLVVHDQRFFSDRQHPARQLLDEVTRRSLAWPNRAARGFEDFLRPLDETVQVLSQMPLRDAEPFEYALQTLRQTWAESEERVRRQQATMARVLLRADERNHLAAQFATQLGARQDVAGAPPPLRGFLLGPWCQALAAASLAAPAGTVDHGGYGAVVDELVRVGRPAPLTAALRQALTAGLDAIGYARPETARLIDSLEQFPEPGAPAEVDARSAAAAGEEAERAPPAPWLAPNEFADSALMGSARGAGDFQPTVKDAGGAGADAAAADAARLQPGHFVEVMVRGQWTRWQLSWASPHGMLYMFIDAQGQPESMTRQILEKLLSLGAMRLLLSDSVVDGALDAVAREALENSARSPQ